MAGQFTVVPDIAGNLIGGLRQGYDIGNAVQDRKEKKQFALDSAQAKAAEQQRSIQFDADKQKASVKTARDKQNLNQRKFKSEQDQLIFENKLISADQDNSDLTKLALNSLQIKDPRKVRAYLFQQARSLEGKDKEGVLSEISQVLNMPDAQMMQVIDQQARQGQSIQQRSDQMFKSLPETPRTRDLIKAKVFPGTPEFRDAILKSGGGVTVNTGRLYETSEQKQLGKASADAVVKVGEDAENARGQLATIDTIRNIDVKTGALEPLKLAFGRMADALGVDQDFINVGTAESLNVMTTKLVNDSLRMNTGVQTDGDAVRARNEMSSLEGDHRANDFKLNVMESVARRKIEQSKFIDNARDNGTASEKALRQWRKFVNDNPISHKSKRGPDGLPYFFYQFQQDIKAVDANMPYDQVIKLWSDNQ